MHSGSCRRAWVCGHRACPHAGRPRPHSIWSRLGHPWPQRLLLAAGSTSRWPPRPTTTLPHLLLYYCRCAPTSSRCCCPPCFTPWRSCCRCHCLTITSAPPPLHFCAAACPVRCPPLLCAHGCACRRLAIYGTMATRAMPGRGCTCFVRSVCRMSP